MSKEPMKEVVDGQRDEAASTMLRLWRDLTDAKALYAYLLEVRGGRPEGPSTTEVALLIRQRALQLREAVERHAELEAEARTLEVPRPKSLAPPPLDEAP